MSGHGQLACADPQRRTVVADPASGHNGIDFVEVSADHRTLEVHFLHPLPGQPGGVPAAGAPLTADNIAISGGERITAVAVTGVAAAGAVLTVTVDRAGDFSPYALHLVTSPTVPAAPEGFDPALAAVVFSFTVDCPTRFDCRRDEACPPAAWPDPDVSHLAKDYDSILRLLHDRLATTVPGWTDRLAADGLLMVLELLAHVGDQLSVTQDQVAAEAYLATARSRVSVRRHTRLLDYALHDGCNARAWVAVDVAAGTASDGTILPRGTAVLSGPGGGPTVEPADLDAALRADPVVFETVTDLPLRAARSRIAFHTWSDAECCLPAGATTATLVDVPGLDLAPGMVLVVQEVADAATGRAADADRTHRHAVRLRDVTPATDPVLGVGVVEVAWHDGDALPFPLCVSARVAPGQPPQAIAVARGNVVLADHGRTVTGAALHPPVAADGPRPYRPRADVAALTFREPVDAADLTTRPAAAALAQDPRRALPAVWLDDGDERWEPAHHLLRADRFATAFVAETERDGRVRIRFGDGRAGRRPSTGTRFAVRARTGSGAAGNVGPDVLTRLAWDPPGVTVVGNPLPARGGTPPEPVAAARQHAPVAFTVQERAVTEADWAQVAGRHPQVARAAATIRWTGTVYSTAVTIDRVGGGAVTSDPAFLADLHAHLDRYRLAGTDLVLRDPRFVPLDLALHVCVTPGLVRAGVEADLRRVLGDADLPDGSRGFFHPDNFTFGTPVYLSAVLAAAQSVDGVTSVQATTFQRFGQADAGELAAGVLQPAALEVVRLDDDPNAPEKGRLTLRVVGGR